MHAHAAHTQLHMSPAVAGSVVDVDIKFANPFAMATDDVVVVRLTGFTGAELQAGAMTAEMIGGDRSEYA